MDSVRELASLLPLTACHSPPEFLSRAAGMADERDESPWRNLCGIQAVRLVIEQMRGWRGASDEWISTQH